MARSLGQVASDYFNKASKFAGDVNESVLNSDYNILAPKNLVALANSPLVKNTPKVNLASKIQNPIARAAASIPEAIVNTPMQSTESAGHLIRSLNDRTATAQSLIGDTAGVAELPLLLASGGSSGAAGQTLKQKVITGALKGAKSGAIYGGLHGLEEGKNDQSIQDQVKRATKQAVVGLGAGALIGGPAPLVSAGAQKVVQKFKPPTYDQSMYDLLDSDLNKISQSDHPQKNEFIKATIDGLPNGKVKDNLLKKYLSDERGFVDMNAAIGGSGTKQGSMEGKYISQDVQDVIYKMTHGEDSMSIAKSGKYSMGALQEANQRLRGFGLLADLDNAIKQQQWADVPKIANAIKADNKYADYIPQVDDYLKNIPKATDVASQGLGNNITQTKPGVFKPTDFLKKELKDERGFFNPNATVGKESPADAINKALVEQNGLAKGDADVAFITSKGDRIAGASGVGHGDISAGALEQAGLADTDKWGGDIGNLMDQSGAIRARLSGKSGNELNIEVVQKPTPEQLSQIQKMAKNRVVVADVSDASGQNIDSKTFSSFAEFKDYINRAFQGGANTAKSIFRGEKGYQTNVSDTGEVARSRFNIQDLKKIGAGSDRHVYDLGDGNVLKVAKSPRGLAQIDNENDYLAEQAGLIPKILERGKNYIVMEKANKPDKNTREFVEALGQFSQKDWDMHDSKLQELLQKHDMLDLMDWSISAGDISRVKNWGTSNGKPILVDGGTLNGNSIRDFNTSKIANVFPNEVPDNVKEYVKGYGDDFKNVVKISRDIKRKFGDVDLNKLYAALPLVGAAAAKQQKTSSQNAGGRDVSTTSK